MAKCLDLSKAEMHYYAANITKAVIQQGASFGAFDTETNQICGLAFGELGNYTYPEFEEKPKSLKIQYLLRLEDYLESNLKDDLGTSNYLIADPIVVVPKYSNRRIATKILYRQLQFCVDRGIELSVGFATSVKALSIDARMGYKCKKKYDMLSYRDRCTGKAVFAKAELKDNCIHLMYKCVEDYKKEQSNSRL
uniref:N-acetyltransferase domain-containing protein n=1 Tax=Ciona savignyi TaxID=51511 RepID=H2ZMU2_CIOSA